MKLKAYKFAHKGVQVMDTESGQQLFMVTEEDVPELVKELVRFLPEEPERTTNLNFWEAYQAMKRGEWVAHSEEFDGHLELDGEKVVLVSERGRIAYFVSPVIFDLIGWYIVPKGPRYKVGDCFREGKSDSVEIIATATDLQGERIYGVAVKTLLGGVMRFDTATEQYIDSLERLPE